MLEPPLYREPGILEKDKSVLKFVIVGISLLMELLLIFMTLASVWSWWLPGLFLYTPFLVLISWLFPNFLFYSAVLVRPGEIRIRNFPLRSLWHFQTTDILSIKLPTLNLVLGLEGGAPFTIEARGSIRVMVYQISRPASFLRALETAGLKKPLLELLEIPSNEGFLRPEAWLKKKMESLKEKGEPSEDELKELTKQDEYNRKNHAQIQEALKAYQDGVLAEGREKEVVKLLLFYFWDLKGIKEEME